MRPFLLVSLIVPLLARADEDPPRADVIVRNAKVITVDGGSRIAEAVAIRGDRIAVVGTNAEADALAGPATRTIDAKGRSLLPGLYDSHVHPLGAAGSEKDHPIPSYGSLADVKAYIAESRRRPNRPGPGSSSATPSRPGSPRGVSPPARSSTRSRPSIRSCTRGARRGSSTRRRSRSPGSRARLRTRPPAGS